MNKRLLGAGALVAVLAISGCGLVPESTTSDPPPPPPTTSTKSTESTRTCEGDPAGTVDERFDANATPPRQYNGVSVRLVGVAATGTGLEGTLETSAGKVIVLPGAIITLGGRQVKVVFVCRIVQPDVSPPPPGSSSGSVGLLTLD